MEITWEFLRTRMQNFEINLLNILEDFNSGVFLIFVQYLWITALNFLISLKLALLVAFQILNPFQANAPFLCPLKTAKKQIFSTFSGGIKKRTLVWNGLIRFLDKAPFFRFLMSFFDRYFLSFMIRHFLASW